jgi:hypothetical protein
LRDVFDGLRRHQVRFKSTANANGPPCAALNGT